MSNFYRIRNSTGAYMKTNITSYERWKQRAFFSNTKQWQYPQILKTGYNSKHAKKEIGDLVDWTKANLSICKFLLISKRLKEVLLNFKLTPYFINEIEYKFYGVKYEFYGILPDLSNEDVFKYIDITKCVFEEIEIIKKKVSVLKKNITFKSGKEYLDCRKSMRYTSFRLISTEIFLNDFYDLFYFENDFYISERLKNVLEEAKFKLEISSDDTFDFIVPQPKDLTPVQRLDLGKYESFSYNLANTIKKRSSFKKSSDFMLLGRTIYASLGYPLDSKYHAIDLKKPTLDLDNILTEIDFHNKDILDDIRKIAKPSLKFYVGSRGHKKGRFSTVSKVGGKPDLPQETIDKLIKRTKYKFLLQIGLDELNSYGIHSKLPNKGILYFFFDENEESYADSKILVHYEYQSPVHFRQNDTGITLFSSPMYSFPSIESTVFKQLEAKYPEDKENLKSFANNLSKKMDYQWMDTIFLGYPIPLQEEPFETDINKDNHLVPLLDFAYRDPKYHVGIKPEDLGKLDFSKVVFKGAGT